MPLIAHRDKRKKTQLNEAILTPIYQQIVQYCEWAGITDIGYFIEESSKYVFANDKLWQEFLAKVQETET